MTKGTNLADVIEQYDAGWVADNNVRSVINAIKSMLQEVNQINQKSKNASDLAQNYSWTSIAEKSHETYAQLMRG